MVSKKRSKKYKAVKKRTKAGMRTVYVLKDKYKKKSSKKRRKR